MKIQYISEEPLTNIPPKLKIELGINDGNSIFKTQSLLYIYPTFSKWFNDSMYVDYEEAEDPFKKVVKPTIVWKNYNLKKIYKQDLNFDKGQMVLVEPVNIEWEIDRSVRKHILGISCFYAKAIKDSNYGIAKMEAWFTEEIPYPDGPEKHSFSLPGLMLEYKNELTGEHIYINEIEVLDTQERSFPDLKIVEANREKRNQYYLGLDKSSRYILSEQSPQKIWLSYPKEGM